MGCVVGLRVQGIRGSGAWFKVLGERLREQAFVCGLKGLRLREATTVGIMALEFRAEVFGSRFWGLVSI